MIVKAHLKLFPLLFVKHPFTKYLSSMLVQANSMAGTCAKPPAKASWHSGNTLVLLCTCRRTGTGACASSASRQGGWGGRGAACQAWLERPSGKPPC